MAQKRFDKSDWDRQKEWYQHARKDLTEAYSINHSNNDAITLSNCHRFALTVTIYEKDHGLSESIRVIGVFG